MSSRYQIPDDIVEEIIQLHTISDWSYKAIADKYGFSRSFIYKTVRDNNARRD